MAKKQTVITALEKISACYPGKLTATRDVINVWLAMVADLEDSLFEAAVIHLCSTTPNWPPDVASIRRQCALLADGKLTAPGPDESWGRVQKLLRGSDVALTDMELAALNDIGGMALLRISSDQTEDRRRYCAAWWVRQNAAIANATTQSVVKRHAMMASGKLQRSTKVVKSLPDPDRYASETKTEKLSADEFAAIKQQLSEVFARASVDDLHDSE